MSFSVVLSSHQKPKRLPEILSFFSSKKSTTRDFYLGKFLVKVPRWLKVVWNTGVEFTWTTSWHMAIHRTEIPVSLNISWVYFQASYCVSISFRYRMEINKNQHPRITYLLIFPNFCMQEWFFSHNSHAKNLSCLREQPISFFHIGRQRHR